MTEINKLIGLGFALEQLGRQSNYVTNLIHGAFPEVRDEFNREVVAFAMATGGLSHMFEWGTLGINRGRSNMRPRADTEQARLWTMQFNPGRKVSTIDYDFKTSVAQVPLPTTAETGIPQSVIKRLKRHVFFDKARILEMGIPVEIEPKEDNETKLLFVPNLWRGAKGYQMYNKHTFPNVSENTKGTFSIYYKSYWEGRGSEYIQEIIEKNFAMDLKKELVRIEMSPRKNPTFPNNAMGEQQIKRSVRTVRRNLERAAARRIQSGE